MPTTLHRTDLSRAAALFCIILLPLITGCSGRSSTVGKQAWTGEFTVEFLGQDGGDYAGQLCSAGNTDDNVHFHLSGLPDDMQPSSYLVEDVDHGGLWATPCDPVSNWFLYARPVKQGETDVYFKPFRDAPAGTKYKVTVAYASGTTLVMEIEGARVKP